MVYISRDGSVVKGRGPSLIAYVWMVINFFWLMLSTAFSCEARNKKTVSGGVIPARRSVPAPPPADAPSAPRGVRTISNFRPAPSCAGKGG